MSSGYYSSSSSFFFSPESFLGGYIFKAFNASSLNQTKQTIHHYNGLTLDHTPVWFFVADWHHSGIGAALKWPTRTALSCQNLTVHNGDYESTGVILLVWIKGQYLAPVKIKCPSSLIKRCEFHVLEGRNWKQKSGEKNPIIPLVSFVFLSLPTFSHFLCHVSTVFVVTNHTSVFSTLSASHNLRQVMYFFLFGCKKLQSFACRTRTCSPCKWKIN